MRPTQEIDIPTLQDIMDRDEEIARLNSAIKTEREDIIKMLGTIIPGRGAMDDAVYMIKNGLYGSRKKG